MAESISLKSIFNPALVELYARRTSDVYPDFPAQEFIDDVVQQLPSLELKGRSACIAKSLKRHLTASWDNQKVVIEYLLTTSAEELDQQLGRYNNFFFMPIGVFLAEYGLEHWKSSIPLLEKLTERFTAEFAVRPFLERNPNEVMQQMKRWSNAPNEHHRRLASEGCRPRLPWATQVKWLMKHPKPIIALIEPMAKDESLYVRRSVANNFNDLAKDHPVLVLQSLNKLNRVVDERVQWVVRHAARSLVKQGHLEAMSLLGYDVEADLRPALVNMKQVVKFGDALELEVCIENQESTPAEFVLDLVIGFMKSNGQPANKVFKWGNYQLDAGSSKHYSKRLPIKPISTRKYYAGRQLVAIQINGKVHELGTFELQMP